MLRFGCSCAFSVLFRAWLSFLASHRLARVECFLISLLFSFVDIAICFLIIPLQSVVCTCIHSLVCLFVVYYSRYWSLCMVVYMCFFSTDCFPFCCFQCLVDVYSILFLSSFHFPALVHTQIYFARQFLFVSCFIM